MQLTFRTPNKIVPKSWFIESRPASTFSWASWSASLSLWPPGVTFTSRDRSRG